MKRLVWLALLAWQPAALAADQPSPASVLAASCKGCHDRALRDPQGMPSLQGLSADELVIKLRAYKSDTLPGTLMNRIAKGYTDSELLALAGYFGTPQP